MTRTDDLRAKYADHPSRHRLRPYADPYAGWSAPMPHVPDRGLRWQDSEEPHIGVPTELRADIDALPADFDDTHPRHWCNHCGLIDPPQREVPYGDRPSCPRCGSKWQWQGRLADAKGTATEPPPGWCMECVEYRFEYPHGWLWFGTCSRRGTCNHSHHFGEIAYA